MISRVKSHITQLLALTNGTKDLPGILNKKITKEYNLSRKNDPHDSICNAPLTNLYFGHKGKVSACCFNRSHLLGTYPNDSIKKIWNSDSANKLRKLLKANDLSSGCQSCASLITKKNFDGVVARNYDNLPIAKNHPSKLEFELSNVCNLECQMCFGEFSSSIRKNREKKPPIESPYDSNFVQQLVDYIPHLKSTRFFGGEPFLIDIYYEIWDMIIKLNPSCQIVVQTNGTILNNRVKNLLSKGNFKISLSIDSFEKKTYETIRVNAKYETVMENLLYFNNYCKNQNLNLGISVCPTTLNWEELPSIIETCNDLKAFVFFNTVWHPKELSLSHLPSEKLYEINSRLAEFQFPEETIVEKNNLQHYNDFNNLINGWHKAAIERELKETKHAKIRIKRERLLEKKLKETSANYLTELFYKKVKVSFKKSSENKNQESLNRLSSYLDKTNNVFRSFPKDLRFKKTINTLIEEPSFETILEVLENETEDQIYNRLLELYELEYHSK